MDRTRLTLAILSLAGLSALTGCDSFREGDVGQDMGFWVEPSDTEIVAGEIVTFTAHSRDTIGRDAEVEWTSTAGDVKSDQDGRIARVTFDEPGVYTVTGTLLVDGRAVQQDSIDIEVEPIG